MEQIKKIREQLDSNIEGSAISERKAAGGFTLSYLEGWHVIDRLNQIFGAGNWSYTTEKLSKIREREIENKFKGTKGIGVVYEAIVALRVKFPKQEEREEEGTSRLYSWSNEVEFSDVGYGKGIDYGNGLEVDEAAGKEAVTDALKRAAKNLGRSMGLALYDKTKRFVDDTEAQVVEAPNPPKQKKESSSSTTKVSSDTEKTRSHIVAKATLLIQDKQKYTKEAFIEKFLFGKPRVSELTDAEVKKTWKLLQSEE